MRFLYLLLCLSLFLCSCESELQNLQPKPGKYLIRYMFYPMGMFPGTEPTVTLDYNAQGKVWRRYGGFISVNPATGFGGSFYPNMYNEISYHGSEIRITRKSPEIIFNEEPKRIFLDQEGRIFKTITYNSNINHPSDTILYHYSGNRLAYTLHRNRNIFTTKRFFFNHQGNLQETQTHSYDHEFKETLYTETETFGGYDQARNPLKELGIFEEVFLRSLSDNNFSRYTRERKNRYGYVYETENRNWTFKYDEAGNIIFHE